MRYFSKTVEVGNITKAAEQLNVAQPALGLQIRQLENELGVPLLVRHSRGVTPTRSGQVLYERACDILRIVENTKNEIMGFAGSEKESLILGITPGITNVMGSKIFVDARDALPNVHLSIVEEMSYILIEALERDEIDLAIAYEVADRPALLRSPLLEEELVFVTAPRDGLDANGTIEMADVLEYELVLAGERDPVRQLVVAAAERMALPLKVSFEATSVSMMKSLVMKGNVASVMPRGSVGSEIDRGLLAGVRIVNPVVTRTLYLVRSSRRAPFQAEAEISDFLFSMVDSFADRMGVLAHKF
ncbi:MAG: LysR family transcriptional regulator [Sedimentitalea sp.]|uniref:LysR family transcriptional regulator n=1 Tax=Sedimentitalea sp. TaxID=2048915 RepID=UPI0032638949